MRIFAGIVIIIYVFSLSKPVQTLFYFSQNQVQIAEELCENKDNEELECNGKCYLMKELASEVEENPALSQDSDSNSSKKNSKSNLKQKDYERLVEGIQLPVTYKETKEKSCFIYLAMYPSYTANIIIPPPQVL